MRRGRGLYMPKSEWNSRYWNLLKFFNGFIYLIFQNPITTIKELFNSILTLSLIDYVISVSFYLDIKKDNPKKILAFEGLHALRIAYYLSIFTKVKYSTIVHAEMLRVNKKFFNITKIALDACEKIISPTYLNQKKISNMFDIDINKIVINRMSVDTNKFAKDDRFKILIVGFYNVRKGHETLLKAVKLLNDPEIVVWIAGNDKWRGDYFDVKKFVNENQLEKNVKILGPVNDNMLHILLNHCDLFALPCQTPESGIVEGLPVALMEAMSYSKTVLSTYHTGIPELVEDSLVNEKDYKALSEEILKYKSDKILMNRIGEKNRQKIINEFSDNNIDMINKIL
jgi:glycosyltransferase involved in cell wall biosynthesis